LKSGWSGSSPCWPCWWKASSVGTGTRFRNSHVWWAVRSSPAANGVAGDESRHARRKAEGEPTHRGPSPKRSLSNFNGRGFALFPKGNKLQQITGG